MPDETPIKSAEGRKLRQKAAAKALQEELDQRDPGGWVVTLVRGGLRVAPVKKGEQ